MCCETNSVKPIARSPARLSLANPTSPQTKGNVLERAQMGEQQVVLKHDADMTSFGGHERTRRCIIKHIAIELDTSTIYRNESGEAAQQRRLSRSVRPEHSNDFAIGHGDVRVKVEAAELQPKRRVEAHEAAPPKDAAPALAPVPSHRSRSPTNTANEIAISSSDSTNACSGLVSMARYVMTGMV